MLADWLIPSLREIFVQRRQQKLERRTKKKEAKWQTKTAKMELKAAKMDYHVVKHAYKAKKRQLRHGCKHSKKGFKRMLSADPSEPEGTETKTPSAQRQNPDENDVTKDEVVQKMAPPSYEDITGDLPSYEMATQPLYPVLM